MEPGKDYSIEIDNLKTDSHKGYDVVEDAIESLMRTILTVKRPNGKTTRVQFLGGNDLDDPKRPAGVLTYSFDKRLIEILQDSTVWGKINVPVLMAFMSKYSVSLYENIAQMVNLNHKQFHSYSLAAFRELMGVQDGQYKTFGEFNKHVLKPAVTEINALAAFTISVLPVKEGKRVAQINVGWMHKGRRRAAGGHAGGREHQGWPEGADQRHGRDCRAADPVDRAADANGTHRTVQRSASQKLHS